MALSFLTLLKSMYVLLGPLVGAQHIIFEVTDSAFNEIVFVGESEVNMECIISDVQNVTSIEIQHRRSSRVTYSWNVKNLQYLVKNVSINDGGHYRCVVNFTDMHSNIVSTKASDLFLNVVENRPQCIFNGTRSFTYSLNDVFSLTCYCLKADPCLWIKSIEGSGVSTLIETQQILREWKQILKAVTGSLSHEEEGIKYMCFYGSYYNQRCELGPFSLSNSLDGTTAIPINTTQSITTYFSRRETTDDVFEQAASTVLISSEQTEKSMGEKTRNASFIWYIVVAVVVVIVFVGFIILLVTCISRNKNEDDGYPRRISYNAAFYSESLGNNPPALSERTDVLPNDINNLNSDTNNENNVFQHSNDIPNETECNIDAYSQIEQELGPTEETYTLCNNTTDPDHQNISKIIGSGADDISRSTNFTEANDDCCASEIDNSLTSSYLGLDFSDLYAIVDKGKRDNSKQIPESEA